MGNMIYIVMAIAVIQGIVGMLAKAKEKRQKAEREANLRAETKSSIARPGAPPTVAKAPLKPKAGIDSQQVAEAMSMLLGGGTQLRSPQKPATSRRNPDLEDLRRRRIEALRRRQGAPNPAAPGPSPPAAGPPTAPPAAAQGSGSMEDPTLSRVPETSSRKTPVSQSGVRPRASSKPSASIHNMPSVHKKPNPHLKSDERQKSIVSRRASTGLALNTTLASRLRKDLRNPQRFRQAFILAELLQPPVSMRKPDSGH